jgi:hypothetical protein
MILDIQAIIFKYKKLVTEYRREKEKLSQNVKHTRKVV